MSATSMHMPKYQSADPKRRMAGWGVVILVHVIVAWALISGTARKGLELIKKPLEAAVIQEVIIPPPPPPPPPPPKEIQKAPPKVEAPPPPFVPPPEVTPPPSTAPSIVSVPTPPVVQAPIAPPPPPAAPPTVTGRQDIAIACPTQVKPEMPRQAIREGVTGTVRAQVTIRDGAVRDVQILSGPRPLHATVRSAMMQYKCVATSGGDVIATQEFDFKID